MTSTVYHWNDDKPHRCPDCHRIWDWDLKVRFHISYELGIRPRAFFRHRTYRSSIPYPVWLQRAWWRTNTCEFCGTRFSGRARKEVI